MTCATGSRVDQARERPDSRAGFSAAETADEDGPVIARFQSRENRDMADDVSEDTTSMEEIETKPNGVDGAGNGASGVEGDVDASTVSDEIAGLQSQLNDVSQTYKRLAADFDNYRKRVER